MPAAFAASWEDYGTLKMYADLDDEYYLIYDGDFDEEELYDDVKYYDGYFIIKNVDDGPTVRSDEDDRNVEGDELWYDPGSYDYDIDDVYFDTGDYDYDDDVYEYTIYGYEYDGSRIGSMTIYLYVDSDSSSSSDGDIYAETDRYDNLDISDISDEIYYYGKDSSKIGTPYYVKFTNWTNGDMYDGSEKTATSDYYYFDEDDAGNSDYYLDDAYFIADDTSKESVITFRIYDTKGNDVAGTIVVNGDGSSSGDIEYSTAYNTSVTFDASDFEDLVPSGYELDEVSFTPPSSSKGTLYTTSSERTTVSSKDVFDSDDLDEVTFAPKSGVTGNVSISFSMLCYKSKNNTKTVKGTVVVSIDDGTTITYDGELDDYIEFDSDDFDDVCYEVTGKYLDYVKFSPTSSKGTLYAEYDGTSKGSTTAKSTDKFYIDPGKNDYDLDDVVFVPKTSGAIELSYTGYNTSGKSFTGKVKITVTAGTLSAINYTVSGSSYLGNTGAAFSASDFTSALRAKTSKSLSYVTFTLPKSTEGTLYYNGSTKVTSSTQYKASGSTNSLDKVSFVPAAGVTGSVTINYTARDTSGNNYSGTVVVKTFVGQDTVLSYSTTGKAASFTALDFTAACYKKLGTTLDYVQFTLPSASQGTLYYGYGTNQQARVSATSSYKASTHLAYVSFLPKAGYSGTVSITYKGYDTTGGSYTGTIKVTVTPPAKSSYFSDVTESWAAPSVDFLCSNQVYSGVFTGTTLDIGKQVTRGEVMQMIYNAFNLKNKVSASDITSNFTDVPVTHPYYTAINACYTLGVVQGYDGKFSPSDPITRQDAITLLYRAFNELGLNMSTGTASDLAGFRDNAKVSSYAVNAMASMIKSGIIQGDENNNVNPLGNLSRGEISVILHRAMTL